MSAPIPCQRWNARRDSYRTNPGEGFDPRIHEVAPIPDDTTAKAFVVAHHYSGSYPAARWLFSARAAAKIRSRERGWRYSVDQLMAHGAPAPGPDLRAWLRDALELVTRCVRHPGQHRYAWELPRRKRALIVAPALPYPKRRAG